MPLSRILATCHSITRTNRVTKLKFCMMVAGPVRRARVAVKKGRLWSRAPAKIFWAQFHISGIT